MPGLCRTICGETRNVQIAIYCLETFLSRTCREAVLCQLSVLCMSFLGCTFVVEFTNFLIFLLLLLFALKTTFIPFRKVVKCTFYGNFSCN